MRISVGGLFVATLCTMLLSEGRIAAAPVESSEPPVSQSSTRPLDLLRRADDLARGIGGPVDMTATIAAYQEAVQRGSVIALLRLGDLYRSGKLVPANMDMAISYYRRAADGGNAAGKLRVAEMTARGQGTAQDIESGRKVAQELADAGEISALTTLGDFYSRGDAGPVDGLAAIGAYGKAAAKGSVLALVRLGVIYRDGQLVPADPERALDYFQRAADTGSTSAQLAIAKGYVTRRFGDLGSPEEGIQLLDELLKSGETQASVVLSDYYFSGRGVATDPARALELLREAMERGDTTAAQRLVAIYRDGHGSSVKRDIRLARHYLQQARDQLDERALATEEILLDSSTANSRADYDSIQTRLSSVSKIDRRAIVRKVRTTNTNVYVYVVQARLQELGEYSGTLNGILDRKTIIAMQAYCTKSGLAKSCSKGPLSPAATEIFLGSF